MPTIRLHVPEADLELFKRVAVLQLTTVRAFILDAADERAREIIADRKRSGASQS